MKPATRTAWLLVAALVGTLLSAVTFTTPASAAEPMKLRVVTFNTDFKGADYFKKAWDVIRPEADIVFIQEAKNVVIRDVVGKAWIVRQNTSTDAKQNSAVIIRRSIVKEIRDFELVVGVEGGPCPRGGILTRYITKVNMVLANGRWLRVASLHMPPPRCEEGEVNRYAIMANNVVKFANRTKRLTILGGDWNKIVDNDPYNIGERTGLKPRGPNAGKRIDGFYVSKAIKTCCLHKLEKIGENKHRPVHMTVTIPAP